MSGGERLSRYDFGMIAARAFGFSPDLCVPVQLADLPLDANRPVDCSLDPSQFIELTQWKPRGPEEGLRAMRMEWEEQQR